MELQNLLSRRRMVRSFDGTPVDTAWLSELCATSLWAPSAGNTAGIRFHVVGPELVGGYFDVATDESWRATSRRAAGLRRAGGVVLVTSRPQDYAERYAEADKASSGLAEQEAWPVPYWHADAAMATMALLLLLEEQSWQATLWGNFRHAERVLEWANIDDEVLFGTVLVGKTDGHDVPSPSLSRNVPSRHSRVRRVER